jgi:hypothetical protein
MNGIEWFCDPLEFHAPAPFSGTFYPAGFPLEIAAGAPDVLDAAAESWGCYPKLFDTPPVQIRVLVSEAKDAPAPPAPVSRGQGHIVSIVADAAHYAVCDASSASAFCWTTTAALQRRDQFRWYFLEASGFMLLAQRYMTPIHAACVARDGRGVLLCGPSGAGKSTLSFACAARGWTFLCDDSAILPWGDPCCRVIGRPSSMRFRESAPQVLPQLAGHLAAERPNGKVAVEVPTGILPGIRTDLECRAEHVVFLQRGRPGPARIEPVAPEDALERLAREMSVYYRPAMDQQLAILGHLTRRKLWELHYQEFSAALEILECLLDSPPSY